MYCSHTVHGMEESQWLACHMHCGCRYIVWAPPTQALPTNSWAPAMQSPVRLYIHLWVVGWSFIATEGSDLYTQPRSPDPLGYNLVTTLSTSAAPMWRALRGTGGGEGTAGWWADSVISVPPISSLAPRSTHSEIGAALQPP